jgi:hypothetical protein
MERANSTDWHTPTGSTGTAIFYYANTRYFFLDYIGTKNVQLNNNGSPTKIYPTKKVT